MTFPRFILASLALFTSSFTLNAEDRVALQSLQDLMSASEFRAAGLDKLSGSELTALNGWLYGYVTQQREIAAEVAVEEAIDAVAPSGERGFGLETVTDAIGRIFEDRTPEEIISTIPGRFRGWSGTRTRFELANGQIWRQAEEDTFVTNKTDPTVQIKRGMFGSYFLSLEGYGSRVKVERVK